MSGLSPNRARRSIPGTGSTPKAILWRKAWKTHPDRTSDKRAPPSSPVTQNQPNRVLKIASGIWLVLSTSPTNRGNREGSGALYVGRCHQHLPQDLCLFRYRFCKPISVNPTKVLKPWLAPLGAGLRFFTFPVFWDQRSEHLQCFWWSRPP